jgi:hypothetical protein
MKALRILTGTLLTVGLIAAGVWLDLIILATGGIEEIVRGVRASGSLESHDITFGILHVVCSGVGIVAASLLITLMWAVVFPRTE